MKQKILYSVLILLFSLSYKIQAQSNSLTDFKFNKKEIKAEDFTNIETDYILEDFKYYLENKPELSTKVNEQIKPEDIVFALQMLSVGAGVAFGEEQTSWCLQAAYYYRLKLFQRSALYTSLGAMYSGYSYDDLSENLIDLQLRIIMFHTISTLNEIRLLYGLLAGYGFGNEKYNDYKTDITRLTLAAVVGFQLMLSTTWSLALETNILAYNSLKYKPDGGGEYKDNSTYFFINKNNLLTLSLLFNLGK
ncbi:hypothetical protein [Winogradskyella sp. SYSU M77433]|uniref:hypothetical protein n=1 Tax=Winogradskyella sp. SYSU M77433 TaxID=3042722 RepID=UPI0024812DBE|nr:hypothetical protein [Winogradskyella sp. SYSU M77433]MDH7913777.1 hypothetical protein [Winogradskyella sp. SYSU M77433]